MKSKNISVLIPNYNHACFLPIQLDSILAQSSMPGEIIIIDDASTDNSVKVIQDYVSRYNFIRLIENAENKGVEHNINRLVAEARGDYVFLSAADDMVLPDFIEEVEKVMLKHPNVGLISGITRLIDVNGACQGIRTLPIISQNMIYLDKFSVQEFLLKYGRWMQVSAMVLKKEFVVALGSQDEQLGSFADNYLAMLIALKHGACFIPKELACWRKSELGYGHISGSDANGLIRQGLHLGLKMRGEDSLFFDERFTVKFLQHWIYMILRNLDKYDRAQKKVMLRSQGFQKLCGLAKVSLLQLLLIKFVSSNFRAKFLTVLLFYPKSWLMRSRYSVWRYSGKLMLEEY